MGVQDHPNAAKIRADAMVDRADEGDLAKRPQGLSLKYNSGQYLIGVDKTLIENCPAGKGDDVDVYLDLSRGVAVYDFGGTLGGGEPDGGVE